MARDITKLHPRLQAVISQLKKEFPDIGIGECFRSVAEQEALYAQGRTKPGKIVTNARGTSYSSQHQWGIAVDFFKNVKGQEFSDTSYFEKVANRAKQLGLGWGGDWKSPVDMPHLYLPDWGSTTSKLKKQYGTAEKFMATWQHVVESVVPDEREVVLSTAYGDESRWYLEDAGDGYVYIRNKATGKYLDSMWADNGTFFYARSLNKQYTQRFKIIHKPYIHADYIVIEPECAPGKYASVEGNGVTGSGNAHLKLWDDLKNSQQKFWAKVASDGSYLFVHTYSLLYISVVK